MPRTARTYTVEPCLLFPVNTNRCDVWQFGCDLLLGPGISLRSNSFLRGWVFVFWKTFSPQRLTYTRKYVWSHVMIEKRRTKTDECWQFNTPSVLSPPSSPCLRTLRVGKTPTGASLPLPNNSWTVPALCVCYCCRAFLLLLLLLERWLWGLLRSLVSQSYPHHNLHRFHPPTRGR